MSQLWTCEMILRDNGAQEHITDPQIYFLKAAELEEEIRALFKRLDVTIESLRVKKKIPSSRG